jgi:alpha-1,6-mannosyltransferase
VIGVDAGALRERITSENGLLVPPHDPSAFAQAMHQILEQKEAMSKAARAHVIEGGYDWEGSFKKLMALYTSRWQSAALARAEATPSTEQP